MTRCGELLEQGQRVGERAGRFGAVAADDEDAVDRLVGQAGRGVIQMSRVAEHASGKVRGDGVSAGRQPLGQVDGRVHAFAGGHGHRHRDVQRDAVDDRLLGVAQREDLVTGVPQRVLNGAGDRTGWGRVSQILGRCPLGIVGNGEREGVDGQRGALQ